MQRFSQSTRQRSVARKGGVAVQADVVGAYGLSNRAQCFNHDKRTQLVGIALDVAPESLSWCSVPGVSSYDVVRGDLGALIASEAEYGSSTPRLCST